MVHPHTPPQSIILMAFLTALISEFVAVPAAEVLPARWQVEFAHAPVARLPVLREGTDPPPAPIANVEHPRL